LLSMKEATQHNCIRELRAQTIAKATRNEVLLNQLEEAKTALAEHKSELEEYEADINQETENLVKALKEAHYIRQNEFNKHSQSILECKETHEGEFCEFQTQMGVNLDTYFKSAFQELQDLEVALLSATKTHWESEQEKLIDYLIKTNANVGSFCRKQSPKRFEVALNSRNSTPKASKSFCK